MTNTLQINSGIHRKLKVVAAIQGRTIQAVAEDAITEYIQRSETKPGRGVGALIETAEAE